MTPRLSLRKSLLYLSLLTLFVIVVVNVQQKALWLNTLYSADTESMPGSTNTKRTISSTLNNKAIRLISEEVDNNIPGEEEELMEQEQEQMGRLGDSEVPHSPLVSQDKEKPWYLKGGTRWPRPALINRKTGKRLAKLWPHEDNQNDRITNQLMFVPPRGVKKNKLKKILFYYGLSSWNLKAGSEVFEGCPVNTCELTASKAEAATADAILFKDRFTHPGHERHSRQVWILYFLECPYHTQHIRYNDMINWTATYRRDSDIVAPYEKWTYYNDKIKQKPKIDKNYAANKTKKVAWFVSNCHARNNRLQYAHELRKYISVDIYGTCGEKKCPRFPNNSNERCFQMLDHDYKFYLAFENSNCRDYITEKFFVNGLGRTTLPIVMGAHPDDYAKSAPEHSYIHVDDFASPKELADYLHKLDKDDELYNSYFKWKGTGEFINTYFMCRLCSMLHDDYPAKSYRDVNDWWRGPGICTSSWRANTEGEPISSQ